MEGRELLSSRSQEPRQGMLPVPWTATGQDGPNWCHANVPIQPHAKSWALHVPAVPGSQSQTLTLSPQQTRALPATRCPMPAPCIPVPLLIPGSSLGWTSANSRSQPWGCPWVQNPPTAAAQQATQGTGKRPGGVSAGMRLEEKSFLLKTAASASLSLE